MKKPKNPKFDIIVSFIDSGQLETEDIGTIKQLLDEAGTRLDKAESHEITGCPVFKCADGKWYTGSVEFSVSPVNQAFLVDTLLSNQCCECKACGHIDQLENMSEIGSEDTSGDGLCTSCNHLSFKITRERAEEIAGVRKPARRRGGLK